MTEEIVKVEPVSSVIVKEVETRSSGYLVQARAVVINNDEDYTIASLAWNDGRKFLAAIEAERKKGTDPLNQVIKTITGWFRPAQENTTKGMEIYAKAIKEYNGRKKAIADKENARLKSEADKKARELEERAKKAEEKGNAEKAEALRQEAALKVVTTPQVVSTPIKVAGVATPKRYFGIVKPENKKVFIEGAIKSENWYLILVNDKEISAIAKRAKGTRTIPGVTFWDEDTISGARG